MKITYWWLFLLPPCIAVLSGKSLFGQATSERPLTLALIVDASSCTEGTDRSEMPVLARRVVGQLPEKSRIAVFLAEPEPRLFKELMASAGNELENLLEEADRRGSEVPLYDTLHWAGEYLQARPRGRIAMLVVSGGQNHGSRHTAKDLEELARKAGFPIFVLGVGAHAEAALGTLARHTGGEYLALRGAPDVALARAIKNRAPARPAPHLAPPIPTVSVFSRRLILSFVLPVVLCFLFALRLRYALGWSPRSRTALPAKSPDPTPTSSLVHYATVRVKLRILKGHGSGNIFDLPPKPRVILGKSLAADVHLVDQAVAEQHCCVEFTGRDIRLRALEGGNGTFVNGQPATEVVLQDGDRIKVGGTTLLFSLG